MQHFSFSKIHQQPSTTLFPYTTLFRSEEAFDFRIGADDIHRRVAGHAAGNERPGPAAIVRTECERRQIVRSEEHTSELQSRPHLVCRILLAKKKADAQLKTSTRREKLA